MTDDEIAEVSGANLLTQTPEILDWLRATCPGKPLVVGAYAYLDGELHVRVSLAMDAIIKVRMQLHALCAYAFMRADIARKPRAAAAAARAANDSGCAMLCIIRKRHV
jgi:hypothetical protein